MERDVRSRDRIARLNALTQADRDHLLRTIGEATLDLWAQGVTWPDLVERCLETIEEDAAAGYIPVRVREEPA